MPLKPTCLPSVAVLSGLIALGLLVGPAVAGPLPTDPNAMAAWRGQQFFSSSAGGFTLTATVEFAVYAPNTVETSSALGNPGFAMDPSHGTQYVYAYEVFNTSPAIGGAVITTSTVGLNLGVIPAGATISDDPVPDGGVVPTADFFSGTSSAAWTFGPLAIGAHSDILFFTMPYGPIDQPGGIQGGHGTRDSQPLPSPTPEPGTAVLSAIAAACLMAATIRRRRRSG